VRPAATDGTYGTNMTYMSHWSYKSYACDTPDRNFEQEHEYD